MLKENPIIAYAADRREALSNCTYSTRIEIENAEIAKKAFLFDCVFAQYKDNYRSRDNFQWSNALPFDCDNDHTDDPEMWITPEDIAFVFPGVPHIIHLSRHHMKQKGDSSPRPRFHVVFLIGPMTSETNYTVMKERIVMAYPFFDANAADSARFFIGTEDPEVTVVDGDITLDAFLEQAEASKDFLMNYRAPIPEGSRNSTLTQLGSRIIKRYGDTDEAYQLFFKEAKRCDPPLEDDELDRIWCGRQRFFKKRSQRAICGQRSRKPQQLRQRERRQNLENTLQADIADD